MNIFTSVKKGSTLVINKKPYTILEVIIPDDDIEDRMRHVLTVVQGAQEPAFVCDFKLVDARGKEYMLKVVDQPVYFWDLSIGFREEGLLPFDTVEVVS